MSLPDGERLFIGDGGLETTMIFREGFELPEFAAFTLLAEPSGREALRRYYGEFIEIARRHGAGFTLDTPTWRASSGWGEKLGYSSSEVADVNREAVDFAAAIRTEEEGAETPIAICGVLGPQGDAYRPETVLDADEAASYHAAQVETLTAGGVDMVAAYTLTHAEEGIGIVRAPAPPEFPSRSPSRSRPTAACRAKSPWARRSNASMPRPRPRPPTSWSTAPTRATSPG
jgi:homocysteine S-methyltransferase